VKTQSARYAQGLPDTLPAWNRPLPFSYQSAGVETTASTPSRVYQLFGAELPRVLVVINEVLVA